MRIIKLRINEKQIKSKDEFLSYIDLIISPDFVESYDAETALNYFAKQKDS